MRSIFLVLGFFFVIACSAPPNPNVPQPIDPYKLSCKEAIERFTSLAKQADLSCQKDSDCIGLGSQSDCDTFCYIGGAGIYSQNNKELTALNNRIFENHACQGSMFINCKHHHEHSIYISKLLCKEGQCSSQIDQKQECPSSSPHTP